MKTYKYVDGVYEAEIVIKHSRFIATIKGECYGDDAEAFVGEVRKKYSDATHNCYAYVGDLLGNYTRFSDDGEPGGTAGQPMLEVLKKQGLNGTACVVTRYFGGIKLGAGGLVSAYTEAVTEALKNSKISTKTLCNKISLTADYSNYATIESYLRRKDNVLIGDIQYNDLVTANFFIEKSLSDSLISEISQLTSGVTIGKVIGEEYKLI